MRAKLGSVAVAMCCIAMGVACTTGGGLSFGGPPTIDPCATEAGITCDPTFGHIVATPSGTPRGELVVFFHGAGAQPLAYTKLTAALSSQGFHVINLRYVGGVGTSVACPQSIAVSDPECHRKFRAETVFGEGVADPDGHAYDWSGGSIDNKNSVMNRLLELVRYLAAADPSQGWGQFQQTSSGVCTSVNTTYGPCNLNWSKVITMGHSLGSGVALYLSKVFPVHRAGLISGPFDQFNDGSSVTVAPWIAEGGFATPPSRIYGFQHEGEPGAATTFAGWNALGLAGPVASVDAGLQAVGSSHQLTTTIQPSCPLDSNQKHNSTAQDLCTPSAFLAPVWTYLAGVPAV